VEARSGHGCPSINNVRQSDAADPSEVLPRRGKTSVPARNAPSQDLLKQNYLQNYLVEK